MSAKIKRILIVIPEKMIEQELPWFHENMGEYAVRTYISRNPEIIAKNIELLGINAWFYKYKNENREYVEESGEADLVFRSDKTYYLVETKRPWQFKSGWEQVLRASECFINETKARGIECDDVIVVLVTTDPSMETFKKKGPFILEEMDKGELSLAEATELGIE